MPGLIWWDPPSTGHLRPRAPRMPRKMARVTGEEILRFGLFSVPRAPLLTCWRGLKTRMPERTRNTAATLPCRWRSADWAEHAWREAVVGGKLRPLPGTAHGPLTPAPSPRGAHPAPLEGGAYCLSPRPRPSCTWPWKGDIRLELGAMCIAELDCVRP